MLVHRTSHTLHLHGEATTIEDGPCTAEILEDAIRKAEDRGKKIGAKQACAKMEADVISAEEDKQKASAIVEDKNKASAILENKEAAMATEKSESDVVVALISILVILVMALSGCAWYWLRVGKWSCPSVPGNCSGLGLGCAKCLKDCLSWMKGGQGGTHGGRPPEEDPESFVTDANGDGKADQSRNTDRERGRLSIWRSCCPWDLSSGFGVWCAKANVDIEADQSRDTDREGGGTKNKKVLGVSIIILGTIL